ncbi:MAG: carbohydrate ABC transporter permease [Clostridiales bacterium]|nr:MAG: carbohydrate ABC transporter permease [Clostridiales bacterium]
MSITPQSEMLANSTNFFPKNPTFQNYIKLIADSDQQGLLFRKGLANSIKAAFLSLLLGIPFAVSFAYPLARIKFKGVKLIRDILLFTMAIPVFATIIPLYRLFVSLQLLDNLFGLVLVYITSFLPLTVWLLISYFDTLPRELEEAAYVDGCSRFGTMVRIILPISYPIIFAASLIVFLTTWNQFQIPLILAPSHATKPIAVVASEFVTKITVDYGLMNAGGILALIPPSIVAIVFRKFLITGIVGGATKG